MYKLKRTNAAVFFIDILGFSALTSKDNLIKSAVLSENVVHKYLSELNFDTKQNDISIDDDYSRNLIISAWLMKYFRESIEEVSLRYNIKNDVFSDCAYLWSSSILDLIFAVNDLMWNLTFKGILCRGGLSYGEIIENDGNNKNRILLGDAVSNAYKNENSTGGKGCRVFTDRNFVIEASEEIKKMMDIQSRKKKKLDNCNYLAVLETYKDVFKYERIYTTYSIVDEFKWYCYPNIQTLVSNNNYFNNRKLYKIKSLLYRSELLIRFISSETYLWNRLNNNGKIQLSASCLAISDSIKHIIKKYKYLFNFEVDYIDNWYVNNNLDDSLQTKLYVSFVTETLNFSNLQDEQKKELFDSTINHFSVCLKNNFFYNNVW